MARSRNSSIGSSDIWPGFVDALATLLLVIIFLLVVFVLAQILLSQAISGKDEALDRLSRQVSELSDLLDLERQANADLRLNIAQLSLSLQETVAARDDMSDQLSQALSRAEEAERALAAMQTSASTQSDQIERRLLEIESLRRDVSTLRKLRDELEAQVARMASTLEQRDADIAARDDALKQSAAALRQREEDLAAKDETIGTLRDRSKELEARLADERERTLLAQREVEQRDVQISKLWEDYEGQRKLTDEQRAQVALLNQQILALRQEIAKLNAALEAAEEEDRKSQAVIADLGSRLNKALAAKVGELQRYRSEFFGRLREVLGNRPGIRVVGDRFVFQSEVLFASGSAELGEDGQAQMARLAQTLLDISREIPSEVSWVLRVDGHTDTRPISTFQFPSNWELSAARAISVVKFLIGQGVPPDRLAATGFGEFQPIDERTDEIGNRRNRRIELKLTER